MKKKIFDLRDFDAQRFVCNVYYFHLLSNHFFWIVMCRQDILQDAMEMKQVQGKMYQALVMT